jgi:chromosome segregation ATPase
MKTKIKIILLISLLSLNVVNAQILDDIIENTTEYNVVWKESERIYYNGKEMTIKRIFIENLSKIEELEKLKEELLINLTKIENELTILSKMESNLTKIKNLLNTRLERLKNETEYLLQTKTALESNITFLRNETEKLKTIITGNILLSKDSLTMIYTIFFTLILIIIFGEIKGLIKRVLLTYCW